LDMYSIDVQYNDLARQGKQRINVPARRRKPALLFLKCTRELLVSSDPSSDQSTHVKMCDRHLALSVTSLDSARRLEELLHLLPVLSARNDRLEVRVTADVLLVNEDVGHGALPGNLQERLLDVVPIRLLVQLVVRILCAIAIEKTLGVVAVGAVGLAEDDCSRI
jgi:hypothetical protein